MKPLTGPHKQLLHNVGFLLFLLGAASADSRSVWIPLVLIAVGIAILGWLQRTESAAEGEGVPASASTGSALDHRPAVGQRGGGGSRR